MRWDLGRELAVAAKLSSACIAESGAEYIIASALSMMRSASGLAQPESISAMVVDRIIVMCRIVVGGGGKLGPEALETLESPQERAPREGQGYSLWSVLVCKINIIVWNSFNSVEIFLLLSGKHPKYLDKVVINNEQAPFLQVSMAVR